MAAASVGLLLAVLWIPESVSGFQILFASKTHRTFTSPNYPDYYPNLTEAEWQLKAKERSDRVHLQLDVKNIAFSPGCIEDFVKVYDGSTEQSPLLGTVCGTKVTSFSSTGRYLFVHFRSDATVSGAGFVGTYGSAMGDGMSTGVIAGIVFGCFLLICMGVAGATYYNKRQKQKKALNRPGWILKHKVVAPSPESMRVVPAPTRCTAPTLGTTQPGLPPSTPAPSVTPAPTPYPPTPLVSTISGMGPPAYMDTHYPPLTPAPSAPAQSLTPLDPPPSYSEISGQGEEQGVPPPFLYRPAAVAPPAGQGGGVVLPPIGQKYAISTNRR